MHITSSPYLAILSCFIAATTVIACKPTDSLFNKSHEATEEWQDISDTGLSSIETVNLPSLNQTSTVGPVDRLADDDPVNRINESISHDKAWLAAANNDICPKLVESMQGDNKIVRKNEIMRDSHCDYYIYPEKGQKIAVESHPNYIAANLISPIYYDFANGSYAVPRSDKYVIRLTYDGIEYKSGPIDYDITIYVQ